MLAKNATKLFILRRWRCTRNLHLLATVMWSFFLAGRHISLSYSTNEGLFSKQNLVTACTAYKAITFEPPFPAMIQKYYNERVNFLLILSWSLPQKSKLDRKFMLQYTIQYWTWSRYKFYFYTLDLPEKFEQDLHLDDRNWPTSCILERTVSAFEIKN